MGITLSDARIPRGERAYAIGDVHGCLDQLNRLLSAIEADIAARPVKQHYIIFVGDYIDRGPDSKGVITRLIELQKAEENTIFLKGNHEDKFLDYLVEPEDLANRLFAYGGLDTMRSYGIGKTLLDKAESKPVKLRDELLKIAPKSHLKFYRKLETSATIGDYFFCHAGIRPGIALKNQSTQDLMWIRHEFLMSQDLHKKVIVHGHTPKIDPEIKTNRINIDTKCYDSGILTCLVLEGRKHRLIQTGKDC